MTKQTENYPTEEEHCWCGEHRKCPNPEPAYCYEAIARSGVDPRPYKAGGRID